jgi:hypothetical protein
MTSFGRASLVGHVEPLVAAQGFTNFYPILAHPGVRLSRREQETGAVEHGEGDTGKPRVARDAYRENDTDNLASSVASSPATIADAARIHRQSALRLADAVFGLVDEPKAISGR